MLRDYTVTVRNCYSAIHTPSILMPVEEVPCSKHYRTVTVWWTSVKCSNPSTLTN